MDVNDKSVISYLTVWSLRTYIRDTCTAALQHHLVFLQCWDRQSICRNPCIIVHNVPARLIPCNIDILCPDGGMRGAAV